MDKIEKKGPVRILKEHLMSNSNQYWSIIVCTKFLGEKILHVNFLQQPHSMMVSEEIYLINIESYDNSKKKKKIADSALQNFPLPYPFVHLVKI